MYLGSSHRPYLQLIGLVLICIRPTLIVRCDLTYIMSLDTSILNLTRGALFLDYYSDTFNKQAGKRSRLTCGCAILNWKPEPFAAHAISRTGRTRERVASMWTTAQVKQIYAKLAYSFLLKLKIIFDPAPDTV